jgi:hypothetical protein
MQDISVRRRQANLGIILSSPLADSNLDSWSINFQPQTPITDNPCGEELKTRRSIKDYHWTSIRSISTPAWLLIVTRTAICDTVSPLTLNPTIYQAQPYTVTGSAFLSTLVDLPYSLRD